MRTPISARTGATYRKERRFLTDDEKLQPPAAPRMRGRTCESVRFGTASTIPAEKHYGDISRKVAGQH